MGWRSKIKVHPAADLFPLMAPDELRALADDIKRNGLRERVATWKDDDGKLYLIDGRNRLDAMTKAGIEAIRADGEIYPAVGTTYKGDPYTYVISANAHRRHLTAKQKRELIAAVLKAKPEKSDRQIAATVKTDHKTVGKVRKGMAGRGEIPQVEKRTDTKGRKQPAKRKQPASKPHEHPNAFKPQNRERVRTVALGTIALGIAGLSNAKAAPSFTDTKLFALAPGITAPSATAPMADIDSGFEQRLADLTDTPVKTTATLGEPAQGINGNLAAAETCAQEAAHLQVEAAAAIKAAIPDQGRTDTKRHRRQFLSAVAAALATLADHVESLAEAEQEAFDNMPENLQASERGEQTSADADTLAQAAESIREVCSELEGIE